MSFQHWFNSETTWNQHRITSYQRCFSTVKQYGINVISTFTHDIETILHQQSLNKCIQHWINIIPISQKMLIQHQITMLHQCCSQMWDQHYINTYSGYWNNIASTFVQCLFATLDQHNFDEQKTLIQQQTSTLHQRCSQCRINVISTFTHDTETTFVQCLYATFDQCNFDEQKKHWFNDRHQHCINVASDIGSMLNQCFLAIWETLSLWGPWHALTHLIAAIQPKLLHLQQCGENTYSPCHKDACVQTSIENTEWLLRYKGVSYTCFRGEKASFHREFWLGETPLGPSSRPRIGV